MSLAAVSDLPPARKPRRSVTKAERHRATLTAATAAARTPNQVVTAAFDFLRTALAAATRTDPQAAESAAWQIHDELIAHADQLNTRR